jgi:hypothetical protein
LEGISHRSALVRLAFVACAAAAIAACSSAPPRDIPTLIPTLAPPTPVPALASADPTPTDVIPTDDIPDMPMTTGAIAISRPQRGTTAPTGAIVFGTDVDTSGKNVSVVGEGTTFTAGDEIAWRVTLPTAIGGESVRVTLTTDDNTETLVDQFVDQAGWNVYYGKALLTVVPGTYVLHYLVDGHELGSGTFKIKDGGSPAVTSSASSGPTDAPASEPPMDRPSNSPLTPIPTSDN